MTLRCLLASDAFWATSGYSNQVRILVPRLMPHCEIATLATFGLHGATIEHQGIKVYPGGADPFANDVVKAAALDWRADIVITLKDTFVFNPQAFEGLRWCVPGHTLVTLADGSQMQIQAIVSKRLRVKVKAWDGSSTVDADILDYQCIPTGMSGEIVEIETENGKNLEVTAENQVLVSRNGTTEWMDAGCVVVGDVVYCNSSTSYTKGDENGATQRILREGQGSVERTPTAVYAGGMGIYCGYYRWRGDSIADSNSETRPLVAASSCVSNKHQRGINCMAGRQDRNDNQQPQSAVCRPTSSFHSRNEDQLSDHGAGVSWVPYTHEYQAVPNHQTRACADRDKIYGEPGSAAVQRPVHTERTRFVAPREGFEPRRVSRVRRRGRPYPDVYDLTTTTGNFVAGGILIHNCPLTPIDHEPVPPQVVERLGHAFRPIAYAPQGFRALRDVGFDPLFCPHAFDPLIFHPEPRTEARKFLGLPDDIFIVGTVAVNRGGIPSRKAWAENLQAFALFARQHPDAFYYVHTALCDNGEEGGVPLRPLAASLGILDRIIPCNQDLYKAGYPDQYMLALYNSIDVLNAVSLGEGFGIPQLECQACGVPIITSEWAAARDLNFAGWAVPDKRGSRIRFFDNQGAYVFLPDPEAIAEQMELAYQALKDEGDRERRRAACLEAAAPYQIDRVVAEHWLPTLAELEDSIRNTASRGVLRIVRREEVGVW